MTAEWSPVGRNELQCFIDGVDCKADKVVNINYCNSPSCFAKTSACIPGWCPGMMKTALSVVLLRKWMHATKSSDIMICNQVVLMQNPRNVRPGQVTGLSHGNQPSQWCGWCTKMAKARLDLGTADYR